MRRVALVFGLVALGVVATASRASAHALLDRSEPAAGSQVEAAPPDVVLHFTEQPDTGLSTVHVLDRNGTALESGGVRADQSDAQTLRIAIPKLDKGTYTVTWRTTSAVDGHTTAGSFAFGVGEQPVAGNSVTTTAPSSPPESGLGIAGRTALYAGLALLAGAAGASIALRVAPDRLSKGPALVIAWVVAAAGTVALGVDEVHQSGASLRRFLDSSPGHRLEVLTIAVAFAGVACGAWWIRRGRVALFGAALAAVAAMLARAAGGHAAASDVAWFTVGTQWMHFAAVGLWVGGLPWFVVALARTSSDERPQLARRFSIVATIGLAVVALTGTIRAVDEVGAWSRLTDTTFGKTLLVKLGLVAALVVVGTLNHFWLTRRAVGRRRWLERATSAEVMVAFGILAMTGVLTGLAPSSTVAAVPASPAGPAPLVLESSDYATSVRAQLAISPGEIGINQFELAINDYDRGGPIDARSVSLRFALPARSDVGRSSLDLSSTGPGRWKGSGAGLSLVGVWNVTATITTAKGGVEVPFVVRPRIPGQTIDTIVTKGQPTIYQITDPAGRIQSYVDPGTSGFNEVHVTLFDAGGNELPSDSVAVTAVDPSGQDHELEARRFGPGHFVVDAPLTDGDWTFVVHVVVTPDRTIDAMFGTTIPTEGTG